MIRTRDFQAELIDFNQMENKDTNELDEEHRTDAYHDLNQDSTPIRNQPELNLLNKLQNQIQIHKENPSDRIESPAYFKIRTTLDIEYHGSSMSKLILNHSNDTTPITTNDVIITITFLKFNTKISNQKTSQFKFLANTPLTTIRDTFFCISDFIHLNDLPTLRNTIAKRTSPSFIYINNTFYVDDRDMVHDEYLDILKGWWERVAYDQPFLIQSMEILLLDIDWQLNTKYLLHHQGDCGHVFVVDEIRAYHEQLDKPLKCHYPIPMYQENIPKPICSICKLNTPQFVVHQDRSGLYPNSLWCQLCFKDFYCPIGNTVSNEIEYSKFILDFNLDLN